MYYFSLILSGISMLRFLPPGPFSENNLIELIQSDMIDHIWYTNLKPLKWNSLISQFRCSVMSNSLPPHGLWHARLPCLSPTPGACSNSCPLSRWCHPTISSPVVPFSSCLQSFPASGSFQMSQFFTSGGQSIGASSSVLPMNVQSWFPLGMTDLSSYYLRDSQKSSATS